MEINNNEFACTQRCEGKWILYKLLLLALYSAYTAIYLYLIIKFAFIPLGALIPVTLWIMIYFTWRYTKPDYKYTIDAGILTFYVNYGKKANEKLKIHIKEAFFIAPLAEAMSLAESAGLKIEKVYSALPSKACSEAYGIVFKTETKVCILKIKVTRDTVKALYYYNKSTIIKNDI